MENENQIAILVANIYFTYDVLKAFGQDVNEVLSVISSTKRISIISGDTASSFKFDPPLCEYESLTDDIANILMILQAVFDRME